MANIICIVCPKGCRLTVDENTLAVTGNGCPRGAEYGKNELTHPVRVVTSTVRVEGADICRCPVKTAGSVPKEKMFAVMDALDGVCLHAPCALRRRGAGGRVRHGRGRRGYAGAAGGGIREKIKKGRA